MVKVVKDGKKVWPTCPACGCRLDIKTFDSGEKMLVHFWGDYPKDARGCDCKYRWVAWFKKNDTWLGYTTNWKPPNNYSDIPLR